MQPQTLSKFIDNEFKEYSEYDTRRSIPSIVDGLKISQRKCIHGLMSHGSSSIKVAQLAALTAMVTDYHHGEGNLEGAIVGLAQNYPGSNNVNLLEPEGQFGSRLDPKGAAGRYIFTKFTEAFRRIYRKEDDVIFAYLESDGQKIEPRHLYPIMPMCLVNGARGIGTGYACTINSYNPEDIKKNLIACINGRKQKEMIPYFNGFTGDVDINDDGQTVIKGKYEIVNTTTIKITELPIGTYIDSYKSTLNKLIDDGDVKSYDNNSSEESFEFVITCPRTTTLWDHNKIMTKFKLISKVSETLTLWDRNGRIKNYDTVNDIIADFVEVRLDKYEERRLKWIDIYSDDLALLEMKRKFIDFYIKNSDKFKKLNKSELSELLEKNKFTHIETLMGLKIYNLTKEQIEKLEAQIEEVRQMIEALNNTSNKEMFIAELKELKLK